MSIKKTLSTMQARLAERLKSAHVEGVTANWLAVEISGQRMLFPLTQAGEIFPWSGPVLVPYTQPWFLGVVNLRGVLSGVVNLGQFLGGEQWAAEHLMIAPTSESRLVGFKSDFDTNSVIYIDRLLGLKNAQAMKHTTNPTVTAKKYVSNWFLDDLGQTWQEINLHELAYSPEFLTIAI